MHENWLEAHRYLNMDDLREHKKEALRMAASAKQLALWTTLRVAHRANHYGKHDPICGRFWTQLAEPRKRGCAAPAVDRVERLPGRSQT